MTVRWHIAVGVWLMMVAACAPPAPTEDLSVSSSSQSPATTVSDPVADTSVPLTPTNVADSDAPQLHLDYGERQGEVRVIDVRWHGLSLETDYVTVVVGDRTDRPVVRSVEDGDASFQIAKPGWTRYAVFTAFDARGNELRSEEVLLDGGSCSAKSWPPPSEEPSLPQSVSDARDHLAKTAIGCGYVELARMAIDDGPFFGASPTNLASTLKDLDHRQGIMKRILDAVRTDPIVETREDGIVYVFSSSGVDIVLDAEGQWIAAGS